MISSMMRQTVHGGQIVGIVTILARTPFHSLLASLLSRLSSCCCGVPTSCSDTSCFSCSPLHYWLRMLTVCTQWCSVSPFLVSFGCCFLMIDPSRVQLHPSEQIRAPLYSVKQCKQCRRIVSTSTTSGWVNMMGLLTWYLKEGHQIRYCLRTCLGCFRCTYHCPMSHLYVLYVTQVLTSLFSGHLCWRRTPQMFVMLISLKVN